MQRINTFLWLWKHKLQPTLSTFKALKAIQRTQTLLNKLPPRFENINKINNLRAVKLKILNEQSLNFSTWIVNTFLPNLFLRIYFPSKPLFNPFPDIKLKTNYPKGILCSAFNTRCLFNWWNSSILCQAKRFPNGNWVR